MFSSIINYLLKFARKILRGKVGPFFALNGDKTLRQEYDLDADSVVLDVGGYEGQWASDIFSRYCSTIYIFEPVQSFAEAIKKRFKKNQKIIVHAAGLSSITKKANINVSLDGSSMVKVAGSSAEIDLIDVAEFFKENNIEEVGLMKINIEGAEYDLLDRMIEQNLISKVENIQVQFHNFFPTAEARMLKIQSALEQTHKLTYQFKFVWENWQLK